MTNEFAIKVLTELRGYGDKFANIGFDRKEALDMAIKALEQEPSGDCISRKAVEKITWDWENFKTKLNQEGLNVLKEVREKVADLSPITPQPKTDGDYISREDVLKAIETWDKFGVNAEQKLIRWQDHYVPYVHLDDVRNAIANMPSVTPQPKTEWIPVSERLPEEEGLYLVSVKNEHDRRYSKTCWFHSKNNWFARQDIEAWMPLPPSYQGEEK